MALHTGAVQRQQQTQGMSPEHILGKAVLAMSLQDLQQFVQAQFAENPALALQEERLCPVCGAELAGDFCEACGSRLMSDDAPEDPDSDEWLVDSWTSCTPVDDDAPEPTARIAAPKTLTQHVKEQIRSGLAGDVVETAESLADFLDDDGYLREPLVEIGRQTGMSVPELEAVLAQIQALDPPGIAARNLRECLLIQLRQLDESDDRHLMIPDDAVVRPLAERIVRDHWDGICRMKLDKVAERMQVPREMVESGMRFIRDNLNPRPASMFRDPWERYVPRRTPRTSPEIAVRRTREGLAAEVVDPVSGRLAIDEMYSDLYAEMAQQKSGISAEDRAHVRECVRKAKALIEALEFRNATLRKLADELVRCQAGFVQNGPSHLKPMTQKELARRLKVHESTVCRAAADKRIELPSGEVVPLDMFFDSALPIKQLVRRLAAQRLTDGEIAEKLGEMGITIARRTVAKYRDQLRVPSVEYRMAA